MKTRIISGLIAIAAMLLIIYVGGAIMYICGTALALIGLSEFYKAVNGKVLHINYITMAYAVALFAVAYFERYEFILVVCILYMLTNFLYLISHHQNIKLDNLFSNVFAFFYIVPAFVMMLVIRDMTFGAYVILFVFISASTTDTFAYFVGKAIGKHKLAPKLSPNKTIEGSVGGTVMATIFFVGAVLTLNNYLYNYDVDSSALISLTIIGIVLSILSQLGDLSASAIKRITGIKDYGHLLPGHGGVLDRMDSALFTAPAVYLIYTLLIK